MTLALWVLLDLFLGYLVILFFVLGPGWILAVPALVLLVPALAATYRIRATSRRR